MAKLPNVLMGRHAFLFKYYESYFLNFDWQKSFFSFNPQSFMFCILIFFTNMLKTLNVFLMTPILPFVYEEKNVQGRPGGGIKG